jgi:hypothetical protein
VPIDNAVARKEITKRKWHFNVSKSSFIPSVHSDTATVNPRDVLIDESKQADIAAVAVVEVSDFRSTLGIAGCGADVLSSAELGVKCGCGVTRA